MRRVTMLAIPVLLVLLGGCADTQNSGRSPAPESSAADIARVRCGETGSTEILTPSVQAQPDGVHISVDVPAGSELGFSVDGCCGFNAEDGPFVVPIPPGPMRVACATFDADLGDDSLYRALQVVDEEGVFVAPTEIRCADGTGVGSGDAGPAAGASPIEAARALLTGVRSSDELVQLGYLEREEGASVGVRRDGEVIAILRLEPSGDGWGWIGFESCPDSGISS